MKANELAERFNKKPRHFLDIFFHGGARMINTQEKVNPHNAFLSLKAQELRDGMSYLHVTLLISFLTINSEGRVMSMVNIQRKYKDEYDALEDEEREELAREHKENMDSSKKLRLPLPRGRIQDLSNVKRNLIYLVCF